MWWIFNVIFSSVFLLSIVLSIPVAFDVGGRDSGLVYSLALFFYYLFYSTIKIAAHDGSRIQWTVSSALRISQWIVIPTLLIWSLGQFAVDAGSSNWVERTLGGMLRSKSTSWTEWIFGKDGIIETVLLGGWDNILLYSGPIFQLLEGFCTLLVIQAAGQITRWLVNRGRSDTWVVSTLRLHLSVSSGILTSSFRSHSWLYQAASLLVLSTSSGELRSSHRLAISTLHSSGSP